MKKLALEEDMKFYQAKRIHRNEDSKIKMKIIEELLLK